MAIVSFEKFQFVRHWRTLEAEPVTFLNLFLLYSSISKTPKPSETFWAL